jgi:hypothetical protein
MAGQADGDRTDHAVSGMRRAPDHDHHVLAGAGIADAGRHGDQLIRYKPLAPLELPVRSAAAQQPCRLGAKFRLQLVECGFHLDNGVSRQLDGT